MALGLDTQTVDVGVLATAVGIVMGVPLAFVIAGGLERLSARGRDRDRRAARKELLALIRTDLLETLEELVQRDRTETVGRFLRSDLWSALSASGRLELFDDPGLLSQVARAYHFIEATSYNERLLWEEYHSPGHWAKPGHPASNPSRTLTNALVQLDPHTKAAIDVAVARLSVAIGVDPPPNRRLPSQGGYS